MNRSVLTTWLALPVLLGSAAAQVFFASRGQSALILALMVFQLASTALFAMGLWKEGRALKLTVIGPMLLLFVTFIGVVYDVVWRGGG